MQYAVPTKLQDGRYYASLVEPFYLTLNNVTIGDVNGEMVVNGAGPKVIDVDLTIISDAMVNSVSWFGKEIQRDTIANYYQSAVEDNRLTVTPSTNAKGKVNMSFFGESKDVLDSVPGPDTVCNVLVQLDGVWFLRRSFGPVWKLVQGRVKKQIQPAQCLLHDSDSE